MTGVAIFTSSKLAENIGFEPMVPFKGYICLANRLHRPLGQFSNLYTHLSSLIWSAGRDLNPHAFRHRLLRPAWLPLHHLPLIIGVEEEIRTPECLIHNQVP